MREIKFRAWYGEEKGMLEPQFNGYINNIFASKAGVYMQYTGLKDKSGREIYEGDILDYQWRSSTRDLLIVEWSERDACFLMGGVRTDYAIAYGEVVGNIYETPELLEVFQ